MPRVHHLVAARARRERLGAQLLERAAGVRVVLTGDLVPLAADRPERALIICNHRTRVKPRCDVGSQRKRKQALNQ